MISSPEYTIRDYVAAFRRRRRILIAVAVPVLAIAAAFAVILPDEYASSAELDINLEGSGVRTLEPIEVTRYADRYIAELEDRVFMADKLRALANDPEIFSEDERALDVSDRIGMIRDSARVSVLTQMVTSPTTGREVDLITGIKVASVAANPEFAFRVADHVAGLFLQEDRIIRTERASSTSVFLNEQMKITEKEILALEKEVADFKVANACCLPELVNLNMSVIQRSERELENVQPRIRALEQDRAFIQAQLDDLSALDSRTDRVNELEQEYMALVANYGPDHPDVNRLRREIIALTSTEAGEDETLEIIELKIKLRAAEERYSSEHPDVIRYKNEIAALESRSSVRGAPSPSHLRDNPRYIQLRTELNSIDSQLTELRRSQPTLLQKIEDYESRLARTPQIESEYQAINRRLQSARDNYDDLQRRAVSARQSAALESTDIGARLLQILPATLQQSPSGPPRMAIMIIGVFLAGTLGVGAMLFSEMTDSTIRGTKDVAALLDMVPLATIPVIENASSKRVRRRQMYMIRGTLLVVVVILILFYSRNFS